MKSKNARHFGLTNSQLGILAGAAVVALLIICGLSWFVFMPPSSGQSSAVATEVPPTPSPHIQETFTAPLPTPSPEIATSVPPGGWVEFQTEGATLWLPASFVGGDLLHSKAETIAKISKLGKFYKNVVNGLKTIGPEVVLWMVDKTPKQTDIITTVAAEHITSTEDTGIDQYIQSYLNSSENGTPVAMMLTINQTKKMTLLGREARQLTYSSTYAGHEETGIRYYIKDGSDIWIVDYNLIPDEYVDMLPIVEQSIHTFNLVK